MTNSRSTPTLHEPFQPRGLAVTARLPSWRRLQTAAICAALLFPGIAYAGNGEIAARSQAEIQIRASVAPRVHFVRGAPAGICSAMVPQVAGIPIPVRSNIPCSRFSIVANDRQAANDPSPVVRLLLIVPD